jgi:DNA (cytosine-5)-methyltransferase 1
LLCLQSFPGDFNLGSNASYQIGMSVPPLMIYKISTQIYKQWFQDK